MRARMMLAWGLLALFVAGAATAYFAAEARVKAAGAAASVAIPTVVLWVDITRWVWRKRAGPLLRVGIVVKSERGLAYRGLIFLYVVIALIATGITYGIAGFALVGT
jgi:hypothetical protein